MGRLDGKVAIITGAARGQGAREAELFAAEGASVVLTDVLIESAQEAAKRIEAAGGRAMALLHDVSSEEDWNRVVQAAVERFGGLHILVNNAAVSKQSPSIAALAAEEAWQRVLAVNLTGVFLGIKHCAPYIRQAGGGAIVTIGSVAGIKSLGGPTTAYTIAKGALRSMTRGAAVEYAADRIRVNAVLPGLIETPLVQASIETNGEALLSVIPLQRFGTVEDVAWGVLYLVSDEAAYITGAELVIDGGILVY